MAKAIWKRTVIAESDHTEIIEGNHYFPRESLKQEFFKESKAASTVCPWKGVAGYYDIVISGDTNIGAAWFYADPKPQAAQIKNHVAFWKGVEIQA